MPTHLSGSGLVGGPNHRDDQEGIAAEDNDGRTGLNKPKNSYGSFGVMENVPMENSMVQNSYLNKFAKSKNM